MLSNLILQQILLAVLTLSVLIQLFYLLFVHLKWSFNTNKELQAKDKHPFSVIVYARNDAENLKRHLTDILEQDYINFEVIVVNDASWDETEDVLREFLRKYTRLKVVNVPEQERFKRNKKFAITMGVKAAQHEHLLFTEANCQVASRKWIKHMAAGFNEQTEIVLGYAAYQKAPGLLNLLTRYENFNKAINYMAFALRGGAYLGSGRNIAYLKSVFFRGKGFASHMHVPFGEDVLFVNQHAAKNNISIVSEDSSQVSQLHDNSIGLAQFLAQKIREMQVFSLLKPLDKFKIRLQSVSLVLFYATIITLTIIQFNWQVLLAIYVLRLLLQYIVYLKAFKKLSTPELKWFFPILDVFYSLYVLLLGTAFLFKNKRQWK